MEEMKEIKKIRFVKDYNPSSLIENSYNTSILTGIHFLKMNKHNSKKLKPKYYRNKKKVIKLRGVQIKNPDSNIFKIFILVLMAIFLLTNQKFINGYLNLYIVAHKDFDNELNNSHYKIICDNKNNFKNKYKLKIIEVDKNNELFPKKRGYSEGTKIYYIWKKYRNKILSTSYVGFVHYRRIFSFRNNIPTDLDKLFPHFDVILNRGSKMGVNLRTQYSDAHFGKYLDEVEKIIKENFTEYYSSTIKTLNKTYWNCCNIFIMKKNDFIKYGEFVFGVLLEFDRRLNLHNDSDIEKLVTLELKASNRSTSINYINYQSRLEAFLLERISAIFYEYNFKNIFEIEICGNGKF